MTVTDVLVVALGALAVGAALRVVTSPQIVRAGLWLVVTLASIAALYLVLTAELVAWVQVLIYVGAVVVLLLFATMLTRAPTGPAPDLDRPKSAGILVGGGAGLGLAVLLADAYHWTRIEMPKPGTAAQLGTQVFQQWVLPFEVVSVLLLAALVGAIVVSRAEGASATAAGTGRFVPLARDSVGGPGPVRSDNGGSRPTGSRPTERGA